VLVHGGSSDTAVQEVAPEFPSVQFLSTHGTVAGTNFSCFNIRQPQSAFLAGALAALTTRSGVVGHLSGIRIIPGLHARAAWAQGVHHVDPDLRIVTCFCGTQDDNSVSSRATAQVIDAGADVIYTMLNSGRIGAIETCRSRGVPQIGNVVDWCALHPDVFIGSAIANNGEGVRQWILDVVAGRLQQGVVRWLGMEQPAAVCLKIADRIAPAIRERVEVIGSDLAAGRIALKTEYSGLELSYEAG
jgi:basic membrane protein A and related proteins